MKIVKLKKFANQVRKGREGRGRDRSEHGQDKKKNLEDKKRNSMKNGIVFLRSFSINYLLLI